jgi:predicted AlkP superfamily phosphohydrolase/phosphomutase/tetratricopeptide (TPR) repeat protein
MSDRIANKVLLIGWDAADWQMIHPLIERGWMPALKSLMDRGVWGNIATLQPILSPMLWNSIATGHHADVHGVHGFTGPTPEGDAVRPVLSTSRKCKALWNILTQNQMRTNVVGWYASHPAEPILGCAVSNQFEQVHGKLEEDWPIPDGAVHPASMTDQLAQFRVHPGELNADAILPFVPRAAEIDLTKENRLGKLRVLLAQTASIHAVATHLIGNTDWDLTAVYYEGIDRFGHEFMHYHPPKLDSVPEDEFQWYKDVMVGCYRFHDMMLDALLSQAGDDTTVILVSDHGYYNDHLRPPELDKSGPVDWHRPFGIAVAAGRGIKQNDRLYGASLLDVTPTVLRLLGLAVGQDMPGRPWVEVFDRTIEPKRILSWERVAGDAGMHPADARQDPVQAAEAMRQLVELGYVDAPGEDAQKTVEDTIINNKLNLAMALIDARRPKDAIPLLEEIIERQPKISSAKIQLAMCYIGEGRQDDARELTSQLLSDDSPTPRAHLLQGTLDMAAGDNDVALKHFLIVEQSEPRLPGLHQRLGQVYLRFKRYAEAERTFRKALSIDPDSAPAHDGLAQALLGQDKHDEAVDAALDAVGLVHAFPRAHLHLGLALAGIGRREQAIEAVELAVRQSSGFTQAHTELARLYREAGQDQKAYEHELKAAGQLEVS